MVVEQMAVGRGAWALFGMEKGDEWDPPGICHGIGPDIIVWQLAPPTTADRVYACIIVCI